MVKCIWIWLTRKDKWLESQNNCYKKDSTRPQKIIDDSCCSMNIVRNLIESLLSMISCIMRNEVTDGSIFGMEREIKIFLSNFDLFQRDKITSRTNDTSNKPNHLVYLNTTIYHCWRFQDQWRCLVLWQIFGIGSIKERFHCGLLNRSSLIFILEIGNIMLMVTCWMKYLLIKLLTLMLTKTICQKNSVHFRIIKTAEWTENEKCTRQINRLMTFSLYSKDTYISCWM